MKDKLLFGGLLGLLGLSGGYLLINHLLLSMVIILLISIFFYKISINNQQRKENLNIIRDNNKLYFYISDDFLCQVNVSENRNFATTLRHSMNKEMKNLKDTIRSVNFINFKNDTLLTEMNAKL